MIDIWAFQHKEVVVEKPEALSRWESDQSQDFGIDPREYNWRKWEDEEHKVKEINEAGEAPVDEHIPEA